MEYNSKQLGDKFEQLPEDIQMAIWDLDLDGVIGSIGWKHKLHVDQLGKLADETAMVLIGIKPLADFGKNLGAALNLPPEELATIIEDINEEIFLPIQDSLKKIHSAGDGASPKPAPSSQGIFEEKMAKLFRVPREEVDLEKQMRPVIDPYRETAE